MSKIKEIYVNHMILLDILIVLGLFLILYYLRLDIPKLPFISGLITSFGLFFYGDNTDKLLRFKRSKQFPKFAIFILIYVLISVVGLEIQECSLIKDNILFKYFIISLVLSVNIRLLYISIYILGLYLNGKKD